MQFGIVGLGRMGGNLARQAMEKGHMVVGASRSEESVRALMPAGLVPAWTLRELASVLSPPRFVIVYVPHGGPTESVCDELMKTLSPGDIVADGGNSHWEDARTRHAAFAGRGIRFLDVGTSGGINGARNGACFMVGGERETYDIVAPLLRDLAVDLAGAFYAGGPGAGHFVKLVHNAIEFGMIQAIAEGVELLRGWDQQLDLPDLFDGWTHGSVIRSWLVELMGTALRQGGDLEDLATYVEDTGEVKWILDWATRRDIPLPVVGSAQTALMQYRDMDSAAAKAVALLRNSFGEHPVHRRDPNWREGGQRVTRGGDRG